MKYHYIIIYILTITTPMIITAGENGTGAVSVQGEMQCWHKLTLDLSGPWASETGGDFNPFLDCRMTVTFRHESGYPVYHVPGYFAADGKAAETGAESGNVWRAHLSPDKDGKWSYRIHFIKGTLAAVDPTASDPLPPFDGVAGEFVVSRSDKVRPDLRARGRLQYTGERYLRFAGDGTYFLKAGPDAPETFLACSDFDNTIQTREDAPLRTWEAHQKDWNPGDPTWRNGKGKGIIGAVNYISSKGLNAISFLPYNAGGDGDNVWPFVQREDKFRYDVSKLDQWGIVFDHMQRKGLYAHFKLQETEMDDNRQGGKIRLVPESLDNGALGLERKLYLRELVARFGHLLALNWNLGEENTQVYEEKRDMAAYLRELDPYDHLIVIHSYPNRQDYVYLPMLGTDSVLTGVSLQNDWESVHELTLKWIRLSERAGKPWVVANDEQNPAQLGVPPDPGYAGFDGTAVDKERLYDLHSIRKYTLWGNLMAGGAGVEYYFGYTLPMNDMTCDDYRSRDRSWDYCRVAIEFFEQNRIPFWLMDNHDELVGNSANDNSIYCLADPGSIYLVYLPDGGTADLDLTDQKGSFTVSWFNPREGGNPVPGSVGSIEGGSVTSLGTPPFQSGKDWLVVVRAAR